MPSGIPRWSPLAASDQPELPLGVFTLARDITNASRPICRGLNPPMNFQKKE
jgi:hypothetical protein